MNPFDELSVEEAIQIRERGTTPVSEIITISAGPAKCADTLRTALAMGADRAIHIQVPDGAETDALEPLTVAKLLKRVVEQEKCDVVILGKQAIDDDAAQTGPMLAGLLGWAQATQAAKVEMESDGSGVTVTKEVDGGVETVRMSLPVVVTTDLRLNQPRYASLPNIMKAKKKPLEKKTLADYGFEGSLSDQIRVRPIKIEEPPTRKGGVKVDDVDGLISKLKELGAL